jgi:hypothetical protein
LPLSLHADLETEAGIPPRSFDDLKKLAIDLHKVAHALNNRIGDCGTSTTMFKSGDEEQLPIDHSCLPR